MKVSNPLTIIAIFAGVAETFATIALVQLPLEIQTIFVYFVITFPTIIVLLFFAVLYFKNNVLYAPGDYSDQNHYLEVNTMKETVNHRMEEIFTELNKKGERLSREEIENAKNSINESIEEIPIRSKKEEILTFLGEHPASAGKISEELGFHPSMILSILNILKRHGLVESSTTRPRIWSLTSS